MKQAKTKKGPDVRRGFTGRTWLAVGLGLLAVFLAIVIIVNAKLRVVTPSPQIGYEAVAPHETRAKMVLRPPSGLSYIKTRFFTGIPILSRLGTPDWLVALVVPREVAVMFEPNLTGGATEVMLFINDQRLGPVITDVVRRMDLPSLLPYIEWTSDTLEAHGPGYLSMVGTMPLLPQAQDLVQKRWGKPPLTLPMLDAEGGHFVEAVFDNRDGGSLAVILSLLDANQVPLDRLTQRDVLDVLAAITEARLLGDLTSNDELAAYLEVSFRANTSNTLLQGFANTFDALVEELRTKIDDPLPGSGAIEGLEFVAEYTITDPDVVWNWAQ